MKDTQLSRKLERFYKARRDGIADKLSGRKAVGKYRYDVEYRSGKFHVVDNHTGAALTDRRVLETPGMHLWLARMPQ